MKLLLHMCCGPCSVYPVNVLLKENIIFEGLFYNPNVHPYEEYLKRMGNVGKFSQIANIPVNYVDEFQQEKWEKYDGSSQQRCEMCYSIRLEKAAGFAVERNFNAFTTTLLVSPYQNHDLIKKLGEKYAEQFNIQFYYRDFRQGFRQGQQIAREMGLYRQKYCGCIASFAGVQ